MDNLDRIFHSLADGTRRAIIAQLAGGPARVGDLARHHDMALPSFMKHMRVLEGSEIVVTRRPGLMIVRALTLVLSSVFLQLAFRSLPLAETTAIFFVAPWKTTCQRSKSGRSGAATVSIGRP